MRTLFIAICKIIGLLKVYTGLTFIFSVLPVLQMLHQSSANSNVTLNSPFGSNITLTATSMITMVVLTFGFAWLLLFRAEWLADKLGLSGQDDSSTITSEAILKAGALLLGLFFTVQAAPELAGFLAKTFSLAAEPDSMIRNQMFNGLWTKVLPTALKLVLGLLLVFKTEGVLKWIEGKKANGVPGEL